MLELLLKILPLQLASTLSPGILALSVTLLAKKEYVLKRLCALFLGSAVVAILISITGLKIGHDTVNIGGHGTIAGVDLILALLFLYFGIMCLVKKDSDKKSRSIKKSRSGHFVGWLIIGFVVSITNFDAVILSFTAAKEIGVAGIESIDKIILLTANVLFFTAPILIPGIFYLLFPKLAQRILEPLNDFLLRFGRFLVALIFLVFAAYLFYKVLG